MICFLLTYQSEQNLLPHFINVVSLLDFQYHNTTIWWLLFTTKSKVLKICILCYHLSFTYLPHRHKILSKEEDINLSWHLRWLLHVNIVVEKVFNRWYDTQRLQLVSITFFDLSLHRLWLVANLCDSIKSLYLILGVEWCLPLVVPKLPTCMKLMTLCSYEHAILLALLNKSVLWVISHLISSVYLWIFFLFRSISFLDIRYLSMRLLLVL